jgi:hypothetical protein
MTPTVSKLGDDPPRESVVSKVVPPKVELPPDPGEKLKKPKGKNNHQTIYNAVNGRPAQLTAPALEQGAPFCNMSNSVNQCIEQAIPTELTKQAAVLDENVAAEEAFNALSSDRQERYLDFCVFPAEQFIPRQAIITFFTRRESKNAFTMPELTSMLTCLENRKMLQHDAKTDSYLQPRIYHDMARKRIESVEKQSDEFDAGPDQKLVNQSLVARHATLVAAYRRTLQPSARIEDATVLLAAVSGTATSPTVLSPSAATTPTAELPVSWAALQDDGYIVENLARHMLAAKQDQAAREELLFNLPWLQRRLQSTDITQLYAEVNQFFKSVQDRCEVESILLLRTALDASLHTEAKELTAQALPKWLCERLQNFVCDIPDIRRLLKDQPYLEAAPEVPVPKQPTRGRGARMNEEKKNCSLGKAGMLPGMMNPSPPGSPIAGHATLTIVERAPFSDPALAKRIRPQRQHIRQYGDNEPTS